MTLTCDRFEPISKMEDDIRSPPPLANSENSNNVSNNVLPRDVLRLLVTFGSLVV